MPSRRDPAAASLVDRIRLWLDTPDAPLIALCLWLIGLGWFLRLHAFEFPEKFLFDEHHFIENARNYLKRLPDGNDHPPLGKLWLALSIRHFGDGPLGWRLPSLVFGALTVCFGAAAAWRLFRTRSATILAAAFLSSDGFLIGYSRAGLLDGALAAAAVTSMFAATLAPLGIGLVGGLAVGIAMSTKFSGVAALIAPCLALALNRSAPRKRLASAAVCISIAITVYVASFSIGLFFTGKDPSLVQVFSESKRLVEHHAALTDMKNPATSSWPTWLVPIRPLILGYAEQAGMVRSLTSLGNLALWWSACGVFLAILGCLIWRGIATFLVPLAEPADPPERFDVWFQIQQFLHSAPRAILLSISGVLAFLAPWVLTHRDSYIYHFLPSYSLLLVLLAGFIAKLAAAHRVHAVTFVCVVVLVAGVYAPLWSFIPVSDVGFRQRLFLGTWR